MSYQARAQPAHVVRQPDNASMPDLCQECTAAGAHSAVGLGDRSGRGR